MRRPTIEQLKTMPTASLKHQLKLKNNSFEHYIKYMGSKTKLMKVLVDGLNLVWEPGNPVCDLFAGSCSLSGALAGQCPIISNDIQAYSGVIADTYLNVYRSQSLTGQKIVDEALSHFESLKRRVPFFMSCDDYEGITFDEFVRTESESRKLIEKNFRCSHHLFTKYYSGTWWSIEQCAWIDAIKMVHDKYSKLPEAPLILSSLMYAMAYSSQGTGHYAQFRDAKDEASLQDIIIYRKRSLTDYFIRKFDAVYGELSATPPRYKNEIMGVDYTECLDRLDEGTVVYADPPYCFVHYSRFYHAIETLTLYDYPEIQIQKGTFVKGRYREDRHQSPFCIRTQVAGAFEKMFRGVTSTSSKLVLSYSNTGMIELDALLSLAETCMPNYQIDYKEVDYKHMTMGRRGPRSRDVKECLIVASI